MTSRLMLRQNRVSEVTRRALFDELALGGWNWSGRLSEPDFLGRVFDLQSMPSNDRRVANAADDIYLHRVNFLDWEDDWIFTDSRFDLLRAPDETVLKFLTEMVHPAVRRETDEILKLVALVNRHLGVDGYQLIQVNEISGRPVFGPSQLNIASPAAPAEPTGWAKVDRQLEEARRRLASARNEEDFQSVGLLCREVLITVAQHVFDPSKHVEPGQDLPSRTDARRMLEAFFGAHFPGSSLEELRTHSKSAIKLTVALQHHRNPDPRMAATCFEASAGLVRLIRIWSSESK